MDKIEQKMMDIMKNSSGNIYDVFLILYKECIKKQNNPEEMFQWVLKESQKYDFVDDDCPANMDMETVERIRENYYELLLQCVISFTKENLEESEFYKKVYKYVFESGLFPRDEETQAVLLSFLAKRMVEIPYYQVRNALSMSGEEYRSVAKCLRPQIERTIYMLNRGFRNRAEEASQIYDIFSEIDKREEQIVFLAILINIVQRHATQSEMDDE